MTLFSVLTSNLSSSVSPQKAKAQLHLPTKFEDSITIIPKALCDLALEQARRDFQARYPDPSSVCLMPILRGGHHFGEALGYPNYPITPVRMSYYRDGERLPEPICLLKPDPDGLVGPDGRTLPIVFAEGVIETFSTIRATVIMLEKLCADYGIGSPPYYEAQALTIKRKRVEDVTDTLPDAPAGTDVRIVAQFWVNINIWIHGMGTDDGERGRDVPEFRGRLSPFAESAPEPPYYQILNPRLRR
jgi:hypothetical protein